MSEIKIRTCVREHGNEERILACPDVATWSFAELKQKIGALWQLDDAEERMLECSAGVFREHGTTFVCTQEQWMLLRFIIRQDGHTLKICLVKSLYKQNASPQSAVAFEAISNSDKIRKVAALVKKRHARCHAKRQLLTSEATTLKTANEAHQAEIAKLKEANDSQAEEIGQLHLTREEHVNELARLESQLQDSVTLQSSQAEELATLKVSHAEAIDALASKYTAELAIIKAAQSKELAERDEKLATQATELASLKALYASKAHSQVSEIDKAVSSLEPLRLLDRTAEKVDRTAEQLGTLADAHDVHAWNMTELKDALQALTNDFEAIKKENAQLTRSVYTGESDKQNESALLVPEAGWCPEDVQGQAVAASASGNEVHAQATSARTTRSRSSSCSSSVSAPNSDWSELQEAE